MGLWGVVGVGTAGANQSWLVISNICQGKRTY